VTELYEGAEDGFHEIQLSGKQLVFLFMVTTVVSVVIFLCGVLVGRGVKGDTVTAAEAATPPPVSQVAAQPSTPAPSAEAPTPAAKDLSYTQRLAGNTPVSEKLMPPAAEPKAPEPLKPTAEATPPAAAATTRPQPAAAAPAPTASQTPKAGTWAVQVVALTDRAAANAVVQRLTNKGFPAFLVSPQAGAPVQNYKVQVGRYADRSEAEEIKNRLKREEQFEPWILR
jgi:cell division septation protein DedD